METFGGDIETSVGGSIGLAVEKDRLHIQTGGDPGAGEIDGFAGVEGEHHAGTEHRWHGLKLFSSLALVQFKDHITRPDLIGAAIEAHDLIGAGHAVALTDRGVAGDTALDRLVDRQAIAAHLREGGLQRAEQSTAHVADTDVEALLFWAVLGADHARCFSGGVGEDVAKDFVSQPLQRWDEGGGVVDGGQGDGADGIDGLKLLLLGGDRRERQHPDGVSLGRLMAGVCACGRDVE